MKSNTALYFLSTCPKLRLLSSGLLGEAVSWFANYLSDWCQCCSQCSDFCLFCNNLDENVSNATFNFDSDDTIVYCCAAPLPQTFEYLHQAFIVVQNTLAELKLVLNVDKTKVRCFSSAKTKSNDVPVVTTDDGKEIEVVNSYVSLNVFQSKMKDFEADSIGY